MKQKLILLLGLLLVMSMYSVGVADERPSWEMLQEEYNQLISRIDHGSKILTACDEYLELIDASNVEKLNAAADRI